MFSLPELSDSLSADTAVILVPLIRLAEHLRHARSRLGSPTCSTWVVSCSDLLGRGEDLLVFSGVQGRTIPVLPLFSKLVLVLHPSRSAMLRVCCATDHHQSSNAPRGYFLPRSVEMVGVKVEATALPLLLLAGRPVGLLVVLRVPVVPVEAARTDLV